MFIYSFEDIPQNSKICVYGKGSRASDLSKFISMFRNDIKVVCSLDSAGLEDFLSSQPEYDFIVVASVAWAEIKKKLWINTIFIIIKLFQINLLALFRITLNTLKAKKNII